MVYYGTEMNALNCGQKVTVQGHGGITYARTITVVQAEAYSTRRLVSSYRLCSFIKFCTLAQSFKAADQS